MRRAGKAGSRSSITSSLQGQQRRKMKKKRWLISVTSGNLSNLRTTCFSSFSSCLASSNLKNYGSIVFRITENLYLQIRAFNRLQSRVSRNSLFTEVILSSQMAGANVIETHGPSQNSRSEQAVSAMISRLRCSRARDQQRGKFWRGRVSCRTALEQMTSLQSCQRQLPESSLYNLAIVATQRAGSTSCWDSVSEIDRNAGG